MDQKNFNKKKKDSNNDSSMTNQMVPKMILKNSSKETETRPTDANLNQSSQVRLLSVPQSQSLSKKNYEQNYQLLLGRDSKETIPSCFNLIESKTWTFKDNLVNKYLSSDVQIGPPAYSKIGIAGKQCCGKSTLLNKLARKNVFKTHFSNENVFLLKNLTEGIDLHITDEKVFLLDSQPLLSASILDDFLKHSHKNKNSHIPQEISDPEKYVYITSLQILSFLISNCDYVIIMNDWLIDLHFLKLISTAIMLLGDDANPKADLVFYFNKKFSNVCETSFINNIQSIFGKGIIVYEDDDDSCDSQKFVSNIYKLCAKKKILYSTMNSNLNTSERNWLINCKRCWETITSKSSIYIEYSRFLT